MFVAPAMIAPNSVTFSGRYLGSIKWLKSDWLLEERVAGFRRRGCVLAGQLTGNKRWPPRHRG